MDPLSDVLRSLRPRGGMFLDARFTAPWCVTSRVDVAACRPYAGERGHLVGYHYVAAGRFHAWIDRRRAVEIRAGHVLLLPRNDLHALGSAPNLRPVPTAPLLEIDAATGLARIDYGGGGDEVRIVCGFIALDAVPHPLLDALPALLCVDVRSGPSGTLVEATLEAALRALREGAPGASAALAASSELLLIEALRLHARLDGAAVRGWWASLQDPVVGRALRLIHARPGDSWSVPSLADAVHASRSSFAERFTALVGEPPMSYVTRWRMQLAAGMLRDSDRPLAAIAAELGYGSESSFSRAFTRAHGEPPASWRRARAG